MSIPTTIYTAIGAISAATIAGGISFLVAVLSKDQKTSEFRQAWIDGLRNDVSDFTSSFLLICDTVRVMRRQGKTPEQIFDYTSEKDDHFCKWEMAAARIKLRINPKEHKKLVAKLSDFHMYAKNKIDDSDAADILVEELIKETQIILKKEWRRVKRGEPAFIATKVISLLIVVVAVYIAVVYGQGHLQIELLP